MRVGVCAAGRARKRVLQWAVALAWRTSTCRLCAVVFRQLDKPKQWRMEQPPSPPRPQAMLQSLITKPSLAIWNPIHSIIESITRGLLP